jgi:hypothetical protein
VKDLAVAGFVLAIVFGGAPALALLVAGFAAVVAVAAWWP